MKLPKDKIRSISFQLRRPAPSSRPPRRRSSAGTRRWPRVRSRRAIDCYALVYQGMLAKQMGLGEAQGGLKKMQKEIEGTKFQIKGSSVKGRRRHAEGAPPEG